jgi:hypothetical protein
MILKRACRSAAIQSAHPNIIDWLVACRANGYDYWRHRMLDY